ncbi:T9SS type A sorting domain-containing protein [Lacinutrix sp. WUR7]|uniref:PQQ-dependent sugar dehydrogenase n=1 Tax=Lacinutrix sp. WUR7 TaxID=2653681 RepID=UPI00193CB178|nr:PQQ-dependent sugar dehydrogenase [Lacinutrix sp. WUR7]QRM88514.1 T9SS type A sorting domain-containing protein [Lacinutrix sp. WUR7]
MKRTLLFLMLLCACFMYAQGPMTPLNSSVTSGSDWTTTNLTADFAFNFPWEITYAPDGNLWLTERVGEKIVRIGTSGGTITTMIDLNSKIENSKQGGLMGMAIHPALYTNPATTTNNYVYVAYTYNDGGLKLRIARLVYNNASGTLTEDTSLDANGTLLEGLPGSADHNSGRLIFGPDSKLYYTIGDQGANQFDYSCNPNLAQVLPSTATDYDNYPGKTLRINLDGSIPSDNPVLSNVQSHVYTYGHRNAQGIIFAQDGTLYNSEHGAKVDDEINVVESGKNYGWPEIAGYYDNMAYSYCNWSSLGSACNAGDFSDHNCPSGADTATEYESYPTAGDVPANFQPPIGTYGGTVSTDPPGGWFTWPSVAPSSIDIHEAGNIPGWGRSLLVPTLKKGTIYRAKLTPDGNDIVGDDDPGSIDGYEEFHSSNDRYRDVAISPDGLTIYAVTDNSGGTSGPSSGSGVSIENGGTIVKITYVGALVSNPPAAICQDITVTLDPDGNVTIIAADIDNNSTGGSAGMDTMVIDNDTFDCSHVGTPQTVWLTVTDNNGNESRCTSTITVQPNASPNPFTAPALEDIVSICEVTVQAPTLINNGCVEVTATTADAVTYTSGQSGVITWTFNDGINSDTATQNVTVNALTVPTNISVTPGPNFADITWDNLEDVTFNLRYREVGSSTWIYATSAINATTITGLSLLTDYELEINSDCGTSQSLYTATTFTTTDIAYCDAFGIINGDNHHITKVVLESIDNSSTGSTYTDFTSVSTNLNASNTYTIDIDKSIPGDNWKTAGFGVWIDYNGDGDFIDSGELVAGTTAGDDLSPYNQQTRSFSFFVPSNITTISTRMRVAMMQYYTPYGNNAPCGIVNTDSNSSEVEDYTINLIGSTLTTPDNILAAVSVYPNPVKDNVVVKLPSAFNYQELTVTLFDLQGRVIRRKTVTNSQSEIRFNALGELSNGVYFMRITEGSKTLISKKLIKI